MDGGQSRAEIPTPDKVIGEMLRRRRTGSSLHDFIREAWPQFEGGRQFTDGWAIGAVCEHAQAVLEGQIKDLMVNIPPRMSKSSVISVCLQPFDWISRPSTQFFFASYSDKLTVRDHVKARRLIESRWYQLRWGDKFRLTDDQNTKIRFDNLQGGYRVASSIDGTVTGDGGDILVFDDPNAANDLGDAALQTAEDFWRYTMPTRMNDFKTGRRIVVQQRLHERDISGHIIADTEGDWVKLILPMEFEPERRSITVKLPSTNGKRWQDPRKAKGELLWPERVDAPALKKLKGELGSQYAIAGQLQQRPSPGEGGIIKRKWFQIWPHAAPPKVIYTILSVDTAMSEKKDAADSAATTWGVFNHPDTQVPSIIMLSMWHERVEYPALRKRIHRLGLNYLDDGPLYEPDGTETKAKPDKQFKPDMILVERKNNGISLIQELSKTGLTITGFNPDKIGDKTERVRMVTPILESERVWVPGSPASGYKKPRKYADEFIEQCASFPKAASRDLVDTMTQALWRLQVSGWVWVRGDPEPPPVYTNSGGMDDGEPIYG